MIWFAIYLPILSFYLVQLDLLWSLSFYLISSQSILVFLPQARFCTHIINHFLILSQSSLIFFGLSSSISFYLVLSWSYSFISFYLGLLVLYHSILVFQFFLILSRSSLIYFGLSPSFSFYLVLSQSFQFYLIQYPAISAFTLLYYQKPYIIMFQFGK